VAGLFICEGISKSHPFSMVAYSIAGYAQLNVNPMGDMNADDTFCGSSMGQRHFLK